MHWEKSEIDKCNSAFIAPTILNLLAKYREWKLFSQVISTLLKMCTYNLSNHFSLDIGNLFIEEKYGRI